MIKKEISIEKKKKLIEDAITKFWDKKIQWITKNLNDEQVEFLFKYLFLKSKKRKEALWEEMEAKYEKSLNDLAMEGEQIQKLMVKYREISSNEPLSLGGHSK